MNSSQLEVVADTYISSTLEAEAVGAGVKGQLKITLTV